MSIDPLTFAIAFGAIVAAVTYGAFAVAVIRGRMKRHAHD